jgi:hypothetical protein
MKLNKINRSYVLKSVGLLFALLLTSIILISHTTNDTLIGADNTNIRYVGRIDWKNPAAPSFSNPGVYIKAEFKGTYCNIDIEDETNMNYIAVVIDNGPPERFLIDKGRKIYKVASGLSKKEHSILICKETESGVGSLIFYGFRCDGLLKVNDMPTRKMECYGNSITCGAKMLFGSPCELTNNGTNWNAANSAYLSYGALTARNLNAQWQLTSVSGIGLIQSCCNMKIAMPDVYDRQSLNESSSPQWDFNKYIPDVVTICLGQNDGASVVASMEFKAAYVTFIHNLRYKYPGCTFFLLTSPMADSSSSKNCLFNVMKETLASVVDSANKSGDLKVCWVALPHDMNKGCPGQGHPSEAEHKQTAVVLEKAIKAKMNW